MPNPTARSSHDVLIDLARREGWDHIIEQHVIAHNKHLGTTVSRWQEDDLHDPLVVIKGQPAPHTLRGRSIEQCHRIIRDRMAQSHHLDPVSVRMGRISPHIQFDIMPIIGVSSHMGPDNTSEEIKICPWVAGVPGGRLDPSHALRVGAAMCLYQHALMDLGVIDTDIKIDNIMVSHWEDRDKQRQRIRPLVTKIDHGCMAKVTAMVKGEYALSTLGYGDYRRMAGAKDVHVDARGVIGHHAATLLMGLLCANDPGYEALQKTRTGNIHTAISMSKSVISESLNDEVYQMLHAWSRGQDALPDSSASWALEEQKGIDGTSLRVINDNMSYLEHQRQSEFICTYDYKPEIQEMEQVFAKHGAYNAGRQVISLVQNAVSHDDEAIPSMLAMADAMLHAADAMDAHAILSKATEEAKVQVRVSEPSF